MPEKIWEKLFALGRILHWFGRHEEMQVVYAIAAKLRDKGIESWGAAVSYINETGWREHSSSESK